MGNKTFKFGSSVVFYINEKEQEPRLYKGNITGITMCNDKVAYRCECHGVWAWRFADEIYSTLEEAKEALCYFVVE